MKVLVIDEQANAHTAGAAVWGAAAKSESTSAAGALAAAGHEVIQCFDEGAPAHSCKGLPGGSGCPVEAGDVDVVVAVSVLEHSPLAVDGARCAIRHFVPFVTMDRVESGQRLEATVADALRGTVPVVHASGADDLDAAVTLAASTPLVGHGVAGTKALREVLANHGVPLADAKVTVWRDSGKLRAVLQPGGEADDQVLNAAAVRVAAAIRSWDHTASGVNVTLER